MRSTSNPFSTIPIDDRPIMESAIAHHQAGRLVEAERLYRQILSRQPNNADILYLLGSLVGQSKRTAESIELIRRAIKHNPNAAPYHCNLGNTYKDCKQYEEAVAAYREALRLRGDFVEVYCNMGDALKCLGRYDEARAAGEKSIELKGDMPAAHYNLGLTFEAMGKMDRAAACYARAAELLPTYFEAHHNLGNILLNTGKYEQAMARYRRVLEIRPNLPEAHWSVGQILLTHGDFAQGWREYEWRTKVEEFRYLWRNLPAPQWDGRELAGRRILLHAEQGFGDAIQFLRFLPVVARRGGRICLECYSEITRLAQGVEAAHEVVTRGETLLPYDFQCSLLSLPMVLKTGVDSIPAAVPYIWPERELVERWRKRLPTQSGLLKVGLVWRGRTQHLTPPEIFSALADIPGVWFCSLQKPGSDGSIAPYPPGLKLADWTGEIVDFADTAALIASLDLVVSIDTAVAHLAGAMGKPVWMLLREPADWRWLRNPDDSPWYPTMRLFRQPVLGDWQTPVGQLVDALREVASAGDATLRMPVSVVRDVAYQHHRQGRFDEAESRYRQILGRQKDDWQTLHFLATLLAQKGCMDEAIELMQAAVTANPQSSSSYCNLGNIYKNAGRLKDAIPAYRRALEIKADLAEAHSNLGIALKETGDFDGAVAASRRGVELAPHRAETHHNLAICLLAKNEIDAAISACRRAVELKPSLGMAWNTLGLALRMQGDADGAVLALGKALEQIPNDLEAHHCLADGQFDLGLVEQAVQTLERAMLLGSSSLKAAGARLYMLLFHPDYDAAAISRENAAWNHRHAELFPRQIRPHANDRDPDRRLRIGYVSPDFRDHVIGRNMLPLLKRHDHSQFEIHCFSGVVVPDPVTAQFKSCADHWHDIAWTNDRDLAELVRHHEIDILIDWTLHMLGTRLSMFANKPAPVQATFAGHPGSTGLTTMDYRLTDPFLDPPDGDDSIYCETSIRLPHSFWCYDPEAMMFGLVPPNPIPGPVNRTGHITFGSFGEVFKINAGVLNLWTQVLRGTPGSRLILYVGPVGARRRLLKHFAQAGVDPSRISFIPRQRRDHYFEVYNQVDIILDTVPYNGHTTSLDALWMGVPVVTLVGRTIVGRAGLSHLSNLGLTELVARTPNQFVELVLALARDVPRLNQLRSTLRERMLHSPLTDAGGFTRNVESAYRQMWARYCAASGPAKPAL